MKIVVCVIGQMRFTSLTWPSFKKYVIDELNADLVTCGPDASVICEYTRNAVHNIYSESIIIPGSPNSHNIIIDHRNTLGSKLDFKKWDQIIISRTDILWYGPHPRLELDYIWFMNREFHFGISDRHTVMASMDFEKFINFKYAPYQEKCRNMESFLLSKVIEAGLLGPRTALAFFPMYLIDGDGECRFRDELTPDIRQYKWPFMLVLNECSSNGMYSGRVI
jgi:hypothetical protein